MSLIINREDTGGASFVSYISYNLIWNNTTVGRKGNCNLSFAIFHSVSKQLFQPDVLCNQYRILCTVTLIKLFYTLKFYIKQLQPVKSVTSTNLLKYNFHKNFADTSFKGVFEYKTRHNKVSFHTHTHTKHLPCKFLNCWGVIYPSVSLICKKILVCVNGVVFYFLKNLTPTCLFFFL